MISADNNFALLACLLLIVALGYYSERYKIGQTLSAPLIILLLSFILGGLELVPRAAPLFDVIQGILVPLAIPLLLFRTHLRTLLRDSKRMLLAFLALASFTIIGALIAAPIVDLGSAEHQLVGTFVASYIGGSANFVATAQAVELTDPSLYSAALTADAVVALAFFALLMALPAIKPLATKFVAEATTLASSVDSADATAPEKHACSELGILSGLMYSAIICAISYCIALLIPISGMFILAVTTLSLLVANLLPKNQLDKIQFDYPLGTLLMYIFFATIGLGADLSTVFTSALPMVLLLAIIVAVHLVLLCLFGIRFRFSLATMMVASSACILGPAAAAALAASRGWRELVTPGLLVGLAGYAIANFIGISLSAWLAPVA
jgi:uncharacterized membrane protein